MAILNFIIPAFILVFRSNSVGLVYCLGKGYLMFFSTKNIMCLENDIFCWVCFTLYMVIISDVVDVYCTLCCLWDIRKSTEKSRSMLSKQSYSNRKRYDMFAVEILSTTHSFTFFRDNGITIEIACYQLCTELGLFVVTLIFGFLPIERNTLILRIFQILANFMMFVVQPLFYLNGDINFRNRVLHQGLWRALNKELFETD